MAAHDEKNFGLKEGMKVEIFSEGLIFLLNGVIDKIDEDAIWVTNAKGSEMPVILNSVLLISVTNIAITWILKPRWSGLLL